ncbi:MAG: DNA gyrase C-terminal beta-propeller domain-containing protein, partial [Pseudomonadota bacterium]
VVSLIVPQGDGHILTATQNGYGKRTPISEYPAKSRATKGVVSIKVSERNGAVVGAVQVDEENEIMLISDQATLVRTRVAEVSVVGRNTQGVTLIKTADDEHLVAIQRIEEVLDTDDDAEDTETEEIKADASTGSNGTESDQSAPDQN